MSEKKEEANNEKKRGKEGREDKGGKKFKMLLKTKRVRCFRPGV